MAIENQSSISNIEKNWLVDRFPFLSAEAFHAMVALETRRRLGIDRTGSNIAGNNLPESVEIRSQMADMVYDQMRDLVATTCGCSEDALICRRLLFGFLYSEIELAEHVRPNCQTLAASAVKDIVRLAPRRELDTMLDGISHCLTRCPDLCEPALLELFQALECLIGRKTGLTGTPVLSVASTRQILIGAILLEICKPAGQESTTMVRKILRLLPQYADDIDMEFLQELMIDHPNEAFRKMAPGNNYEIARQLKRKWDDTPADQVSTAQSRAKRLWQLTTEIQVPIIVLGIYNSMKGLPIVETSDPRIEPLAKLMAHRQPEVAIAAVWSVCTGGSYNCWLDDCIGGIRHIADLAVNSNDFSIGGEAASLLKFLQSEYPTLHKRINSALDTANNKFIDIHTAA